MTQLSPMRAEFFQQFKQQLSEDYAKENVKSGRWPEHNALERAKGEMERSLPQGIATPDNYLFEIKTDQGETAGCIWFAVEERQGGAARLFIMYWCSRSFAVRATPAPLSYNSKKKCASWV